MPTPLELFRVAATGSSEPSPARCGKQQQVTADVKRREELVKRNRERKLGAVRKTPRQKHQCKKYLDWHGAVMAQQNRQKTWPTKRLQSERQCEKKRIAEQEEVEGEE